MARRMQTLVFSIKILYTARPTNPHLLPLTLQGNVIQVTINVSFKICFYIVVL